MDKNTLVQSMEKRYGSFVNVNEVAEFMTIHRNTARTWLAGVPYIGNGTEKKYFVNDVAKMIIERKTI